MTDVDKLYTDLDNHHIEGFAAQAIDLGFFSVPLISHVDGNLYQGGCLHGVRLPDDIKFVLSLYKWEKYDLGPDTERVEVTMYDSGDVPDEAQLYELARLINEKLEEGKVLVHCQAGLNRSGLLAGLALVLQGYTPDNAITKLRDSRCAHVLCNKAFEYWLRQQTPPEDGD